MNKIKRLTKYKNTFTLGDLSWSRQSKRVCSALDFGKVRCFWVYFGIFPIVSRFSCYKTLLWLGKTCKQACLLLSAYETLRCYGIAPVLFSACLTLCGILRNAIESHWLSSCMETYSKYPPKSLEINF